MIRNFKQGAMFGLDARITIVILAAIASISGVVYYNFFYTINANKTLYEARTIAKSLEIYQKDMNSSIFNTLTNGLTAENKELYSFKALVENVNIKAPFTNRWQGPYLKFRYADYKDPYLDSEFRLVSLSNSLSTTCNDSNINRCYVFLKFKAISNADCKEFDQVTGTDSLTKSTTVYNGSDCDLYIKLIRDF